MFIDICIPDNNEEEFIETAEKLETDGLLFLYKDKKQVKEIKSEKLKIYTGLLVNKKPGHKGIHFAKGERQNAENKNIPFLYGFEELEKKDSMHHRRSGLNQVLCNIIKEKEKTIILDFEKLLEGERTQTLGRMMQNLDFIRKYDLNVAIASFATKPKNLRAKTELASLIRSFGHHKKAKEAITTLEEQLRILT